MKFRTEFRPERSSLNLDVTKPAILIGSCFSQNIAARMNQCGWEAYSPTGTLYNPLSIALAIDMMLDPEKGANNFQSSIFEDHNIFNSRFYDSSFSSLNPAHCLQEFELRQKLFNEKIREGKLLLITFGTSICYFLNSTGEAVGNCHRRPASEFTLRRLGIDEIAETWKSLIGRLRMEVPDLKIIFTVSPVRHLKDGFTGNSRSKATLALAIEKICEDHTDCHYFPAYEIINDDLRDYRFYASDLVHPSDEAIQYIWEMFSQTFLDAEGIRRLEEGERRIKAEGHRPHLGALGHPLI